MRPCGQPGSICPSGQICCNSGACGLVCVQEYSKPIRCRNGLLQFECKVNPCDIASCPRNLRAECRPNYCGGCKAEFFIGNKKVNCRNGKKIIFHRSSIFK